MTASATVSPSESPQGTHGGARENAGRKPAGYKKPPEDVEFGKARARSETAKARKLEIELLVLEGEYIARSAVQQASATTMASLAQTLRSVPDNLERKGLPREFVAMVERTLDEAMAEASAQMQLMSGSSDEGL